MENKGFIQQTADDYDMNYSDVEYIYRMWYDKGMFYDKLEDFIKNRSQTH